MHIYVMDGKAPEKHRKRFRRVSRARILEGHPLKVSLHAFLVMVSASIILTSSVALLFSYIHGANKYLFVQALLPGAFLGYGLLILERMLSLMKNSLFPRMGRLLTAFLLFFSHFLGYLALSSIMVNFPLGQLMDRTNDYAGLGGEFSLFSVNFFIVLAILSWLRNVRSGPSACF